MKDKRELKLLISKYLNNEASLYEMSRLDTLLEEDPDVTDWISEMIENSDPSVSPEIALRLNKIYELKPVADYEEDSKSLEISNDNNIKFKTGIWGLVAGIVAIVVSASLFLLPDKDNLTAAPLIVSTSAGERSQVQLPDGSLISLNHNTKISYTYDSKLNTRNITLTGEAYFDVNSDPEHPFIVSCDGLSIECKGTSFNVKGYPEEQNVTAVLASGTIVASASRQTITMKPGTKVAFNKQSRDLQSTMVDVNDYTAWISGNNYYNDERLEDIMHSVSRQYGVTINIVTPSLKDVRLSGSIGGNTLDETLAILASASGAKYFTESDSTICFYRAANP